MEERLTEEIGVKLENAAKVDNFNQDFLHADSKKDVPATNGNQELQIDKLVSDLVCFSVFVNMFPNYKWNNSPSVPHWRFNILSE